MRLVDQVALVTGAASGLGRGCALALGAAACAVLINHLAGDEGPAGVLAFEVEAAGGNAFPFAADISMGDEVEPMFAEVRLRRSVVQPDVWKFRP